MEVEDGIITHVGNGLVGNAYEIKGLLMPSLVNFHVHSGDYMVMEEGYQLTVKEAVGDPLSFKYKAFSREGYDVSASIRLFLRESLRLGVKTVVDFREQGIQGSKLAKTLKGQWVNYFILGRLEEEEFSREALRELMKYADGYGLPSPSAKYDFRVIKDSVKLRASHFAETLSQWLKYDLESFIEDFSPSFLVHGVWLDEEEMRVLADRDVPLVMCPRSNMWFSVGIPKVDLAMDSQVKVFFGTDNGAWISPNLWKDMELALLISRTRKPGSDYSKQILKGSTTLPSSFLGIKNRVEEGTPLNMLNVVDDENSGIKISKNKYMAIIKRGGDYILKSPELSKQ
ncbi:amidohydrolase family protein [Sulfuracidifex tepidarius]|uniref:amidohydrolase family protein n=1 Tax=Sulfuracidifex tepidarius TaxID=1294262 RepID=UPI0006D247E5|nr:amidohydrolase family protein [Sulfuracidifex tepidarius]